ncbi:MAG: hypothetical protein IKQ35_03115 [Bacilli bacterium]|nr:hypothetical protein [Bacilli bacterium]
MRNTNVYAQDLENYLKVVNNLNLRTASIKKVTKSLSLSRKTLGISSKPDIDDTFRLLSEFDTVRLEMIERIEDSPLLESREIAKEITKAGFSGAQEFIAEAKRQLSGVRDEGALKRVLMRGEARRIEAKKAGDYLVEQDNDVFHPTGRIDESEIGQAINVHSVKQLVRSFR